MVASALVAGCAGGAPAAAPAPDPTTGPRPSVGSGAALTSVPATTLQPSVVPSRSGTIAATSPTPGQTSAGWSPVAADAVAEDFLAAEALHRAIVSALPDADPERLRRYASGPLADRWVEEVRAWIRAGWRVRPGPRGIERTVVLAVRPLGPDAVELDSCTASDGVVYRPRPQDPPGGGVVIDGLLATSWRRWRLEFGDGTWRRSEVEELDWVEGRDGCPS